MAGMTTLTEGNGTVLKVDIKGRVHTPPQRREQILDEFEKSGLSGQKFAELTGIKYQTFAGWAARRRAQRGLAPSKPSQPSQSVRWLEAVVSEAAAAPPQGLTAIKVVLGTGAWVEFSQLNQVALVAALLQAMDKPSPRC